MDTNLCVIPENPAPAGANVARIAACDKVSLRAAWWRCDGACLGTVAILPGRAEFIEKYFEVAGELLERGFDVAVLDWRGQGLSDRLLRDRRKGHVARFTAYERDLDAFRDQVLEFYCRRPFFALGHSMGAAILLAQAHAGRSPFERLVLTAPMIDLYGLRWPQSARALVRALALTGCGRLYIPTGRAAPYLSGPFAGNVLTSDPGRYARVAAVVAAAPEVAIGDPTIGWVNAAFRLMRRFEKIEFPRRTLTPILLLAAGDDQVVDTAAAELFASRLKAGRGMTIPYARHEILLERDQFRDQFWAAFDAFIPGQSSLDQAGLDKASSKDAAVAGPSNKP